MAAAVAATPASATIVLQRWQKIYDLTECQLDVLRPEVEGIAHQLSDTC